MIFFLRLLKQSLMLLLVSIPLQLVGAIVVGIYLLIDPTCKKLPTYLKWFDGADQYVGRNTDVYVRIMSDTMSVKYVWLCWRNPINYFSYSYLGFQVNLRDIDKTRSYEAGDPEVGDSTGDHEGLFYVEVVDFDSNVYYEYYYIKKWTATTCFRFRCGWKIGSLAALKDGEYVQDVLVCQPYKSYSGQ